MKWTHCELKIHTHADFLSSYTIFPPLNARLLFCPLQGYRDNRCCLATARCHGGDEGAVFFRPRSLFLGAFFFTVGVLRAVRDDVVYYSMSHLFLVNLTSTMTHVWWRCHSNRRVELHPCVSPCARAHVSDLWVRREGWLPGFLCSSCIVYDTARSLACTGASLWTWDYFRCRRGIFSGAILEPFSLSFRTVGLQGWGLSGLFRTISFRASGVVIHEYKALRS